MTNRHFDRRTFLRYLGIAAPAATLGCSRAGSAGAYDAQPAPPPPSPAPTYSPAAVCAPTEPNIEGPFFKTGAPVRTRLATPGERGLPLSLSGRVVGPDCATLSDVDMEIWQADATGAYDNQGNRFRARTRLVDGQFALDTIVPGRYLGGSTYRPAHIHIKLAAAGFAPLTTQLYFPGDPYNRRDPFFRPSLKVHVAKRSSSRVDASYRFALQR